MNLALTPLGIICALLLAGPVQGQTGRFEPGIVIGSATDYMAHKRRVKRDDGVAGVHVRYLLLRLPGGALRAYGAAEWTRYYWFAGNYTDPNNRVEMRASGPFTIGLGPELAVRPLAVLELRAAALLGRLSRDDVLAGSERRLFRAVELGLALRPNRHGLRLRGLGLAAGYRTTLFNAVEIFRASCFAGPCEAPVVTRHVTRRFGRFAAGLNYEF